MCKPCGLWLTRHQASLHSVAFGGSFVGPDARASSPAFLVSLLSFCCFLCCRLLGVGRMLGRSYSTEGQSTSDRREGTDDSSPSPSGRQSLTTYKVIFTLVRVSKVVDVAATKV
jgi:hypothetical protein